MRLHAHVMPHEHRATAPHLRATARAASTATAAPAAADASAMPRRSGVETSEGGAAGGAMGSAAVGGASVYSKLLGAWWWC